MIKKTVKIDEEKCIGCGMCANTCHNSVIEVIDGKAKLVKEDVCDGLGRCLPVCPVNAIEFIEKEIPDEVVASCGCSSSAPKEIHADDTEISVDSVPSRLSHWPVQIKLVPVNASYFDNADILIAADCTAYSYGNFHNDFMKNKVTLIGCPKLDDVNYADKLSDIFKYNNIRSIKVVKMEVPCCNGISNAVKNAVSNSKKDIPLEIVTLDLNGNIK